MEKISVVILLNNENNNINKCIESVVNQTLNSFEIICFGDNLSNNVNVAIEKYKSNNKISIIKQSNKTLSNDILNKINGEYIYFIESYQILEVFALEMLYLNAKMNDLDIIYFNQQHCNINTEKTFTGAEFIKKININSNFNKNITLQLFKKDFLTKNNIKINNIMINQELISSATKVRNLNTNLNLNTKNVSEENLEQKKQIDSKNKQIEDMKKQIEQLKNDVSKKDAEIKSYKNEVSKYKSLSNKYKGQSEYNIKQKHKLQGQVKYHKKDKASLKNSKSYKIGRIITYIPRKIKNV